MKTVVCLILCLFCCLGSVGIHPAMAQRASSDPLISLVANNEPLGDVLESITRETGYQFNLDRRWRDHPVSAAITDLPLERGLKRLLRSLNHTIIWESDNRITIMVVGKVDSVKSGSAISFPAPLPTIQEADGPVIAPEDAAEEEPEPTEAAPEAADADIPAGDGAGPESGEVESSQEVEDPPPPNGEVSE
ncbi:hypothetical protein [Desulfosarcina sp.]|uniref:hypothetical protein n=1 Tax=Desulfosarcina sp. TaxID=2027861 RepID=UPI0039709D04